MANDTTENYQKQITQPARNIFAITPHASNEVDSITRGLGCLVSGDAVVRAVDSSADVTIYLTAGSLHPVSVKYVRAVGTAATGIYGVY